MHHLYRHFDKRGKLLYVGISLSALQRLGQHRENAHWYSEISKVTIHPFRDQASAENAERRAIKSEKPLHNVLHANQASDSSAVAESDALPMHVFAPTGPIWRIRRAILEMGCSRSKFYSDVAAGLMTPAIKIGPRASGWPSDEVEAIKRARIAGMAEEQIRRLVQGCLAARKDL